MVKQISSTLTIKIRKQAENYTIEANGTKGIKVNPQPAPQLKTLLSDQKLADTLKDLSSQTAPVTTEAIQELGKALFEYLLAGDLLRAFDRAQGSASADSGVRLRLQIEPAELAAFPWETLHDGKGWLSAQSTTPLVRKLALSENRKLLQKLQIRGALRILFVGASPEGLDPLKIQETAEELEILLAAPIKKKQIAFHKLLNATLKELRQELLKDYHILYFAGHGIPEGIFLDDGEGDEIKQAGKVIGRERGEKSLVSAETLAKALEGKQTRLVFLAACETSKASDKTLEGSRLLRGFAQELAERSNLPAIVAMQYFISDMQANPLTTQFFAALAAGRPVDVAMAEARSGLIKKGQVNRDVFSPVLYLQAEDSALFPRTKNWVAIGLSVALVAATIVGGVLHRNVEIQQIQSLQSSAERKLESGSGLDAVMDSLRAGKALKQSVWQSILPKAGLREQVTRTLRTTFYATKERDRWTWNQGEAREVFFKPDGQPSLITSTISSTNSGFSLVDLQSGVTNSLGSGHKILISPQGDKVAILEEETIEINKISLHNLKGQLLFTPKKANNAVFSPDGKLLLISAKNNGNVQIFDQQQQIIASFSKIRGKLNRAYYNAALQQLVTFTTNDLYKSRYVAQVWHQDGKSETLGRESGEVGLKVVRHMGPETLKFSPNGRSLHISTPTPDIGSEFERWHYGDCLLIRTFCWSEGLSNVRGITGIGDITNPNNSNQELIAVPKGSTVSLFDKREILVDQLVGGSIGQIEDVTFSPNGRLLATAGSDKTVRLWDLQGNQPQRINEFDARVQNLAISSGKNQFVSFQQDGIIKLWDLNGKLLLEFHSSVTKIKDIDLSNDGKYIAIVEENGIVHLWTVQNNQASKIPISIQETNSISFMPDSQRLATGGRDGFIRIWSLQGVKQQEIDTKTEFEQEIDDIIFSSDSHRMIVKRGSVVTLWDLVNKPSMLSRHTSIFDVGFDSTGKLLFIVDRGDGNGNDFHLEDSQENLLGELEPRGMRGTGTSATFSPNGKLFAAATHDGKVIIWDTSGKHLAELQVFSNDAKSDDAKDYIKSLHFSSDGQRLITLTKNGLMALWSIGNLDELMTRSCDWVRNYLAHSPNAADRHLCDGIENATSSIAANPPSSPSHISAPRPSSSKTASETVPISPSVPSEPVTVKQPIVSTSPKITQKEALDLIRKWLQQKQQVFAPPYNLEVLARYTSGEYYQSKQSEAKRYRSIGAQVRFSGLIVEPTSPVVVQKNQAIIGVSITETCTYIQGKATGDCSSQKQAYRYTLQFDGNDWKIIKAMK